MKQSDIFLLVYGCIPLDTNWAINTIVYKEFIKKHKNQ